MEVSAHYLRDRLGLGDHLSTAHPQDGVTDVLLRRAQHRHRPADGTGSSSFVPQVTYQIDRGRLENELNRRCSARGVAMVSGRVRSVELGAADHPTRIVLQDGDSVTHTRHDGWWMPRGRNRLLPRQLELKQANQHLCNAAWFRVATEIDIGRWSDDPGWQAWLTEGDRAMSTNHLMGRAIGCG